MTAEQAKLPVLKTVAMSYSTAFAHIRPLAISAALWAGTAMAALIAIGLAPLALRAGELSRLWLLIASFVMLGLTFLVTGLSAAGTAVDCHRYLLLRERPRGPLLLLSRPFRAYAWRGAAIAAAVIGALVAVGAVTEMLVPIEAMIFSVVPWIPIIAYVVALCIIAGRFSLVLPAAATGDANVTFARAWALSRGHGWRLFGGQLAVLLPAGLVGWAFARIVATVVPQAWPLDGLARVFAAQFVVAAMSALSATFAAAAYRFLAAPAASARSIEDLESVFS
jgi:hypothetical protein